MKKIVIVIGLALVSFLLAQSTYGYTFIDHENAIASDSPYALTYTTEAFDSNYNWVHIKLAPSAGYDFYGSYVLLFINFFDDERLASFDTLVQDGWIGTFPNQIPRFVSAQTVSQYSSTNQLKQKIGIASYTGDVGFVMIRFNQVAAATDYYLISVLLDEAVSPSTYINSIINPELDTMVRISSITQAQFEVIFDQGYQAAVDEINAEYDVLIDTILQLESYIAQLELQLEGDPVETSASYGPIQFFEDYIIYIIAYSFLLIFVGTRLVKKSRYKKKYY